MSYIVPREKPKCHNCPFRTLDYCGLLIEHDCVTVNVNEMTVSKYCPLVEIPTPHGRLIDADEPITKISTMIQEPDYQHEGENWMIGLIMARDVIDDAPTVIKAEG